MSLRISVPLVRMENGLAAPLQRSDDAGHQLVAALRPLVAIHVRAHRDVLARPARRGHLLAHQLGRVHLDYHPGVEVRARVEVQVGV